MRDSRSPGNDSNPGSPEYGVGVLTTRPQRSVEGCGIEYGSKVTLWK